MAEISLYINPRDEYIPKRTLRLKGKSLIQFPDEYVVVDTETTGLDPQINSLIEIGAIKYKNNIEVASFCELVKPSSWHALEGDEIKETSDYCIRNGEYIQYVDSYITNLTGITNKMLENAREEKAVIDDFLEFLGDQVIVGHNVNFDINFLYDAVLNHYDMHLSNDYLDTMRIARKLLKNKLSQHRLKDIAEYYGIDHSNAHRALGDCQTTHDCLISMKKDIFIEYETLDIFSDSYKNRRQGQAVRAKDITSQTYESDLDHPLYNRVCVFTGSLERITRKEIMQIVADLGGINGDSVTTTTNYLILGNLEYSKNIKDGKSNKLKKAENLKLKGHDIEILSENVFYDMLADGNLADSSNIERTQMKHVNRIIEKPKIELDQIKVIFRNVAQSLEIPNDWIIFEPEKTIKEQASTWYLRVKTTNIASIKKLKNGFELVVPKPITLSKNFYQLGRELTTEFRFMSLSEPAIYWLLYRLTHVAMQSVITFDIGCCHRFVQCSDHRRCISENPDIKFSCVYRQHLLNGKIFYGKNRNN